MWKIALLVLLLAGCASGPPKQWVASSWAKMGYDRAEATCIAAVQRNPFMGYPVCMKAVGWQEQ